MLPYRLVLSPRLAVPRWLTAATLIGGIVFGLICCALFLIAFGVPAGDLANQFILYVFGNSAGLDQTLTRAISLVLVSLSVGAIWCGIAAVAKIRLRADEVITTLLLNYVGYLFAQDLLYNRWRNPTDQFPVSPTFAHYEQLPTFGGWHLHYGVFIALAATAYCGWLCRYSRFGLLSQAVAENRTASRALGIPVARITLTTACLAGAISGLAGFSIVSGEEHKLTQFVGNDYIFPSIAVAYLGRANPLGVLVAALAVAGLYTAGDSLKAFYQLPDTVVVTMEAFLLMTVAACDVFIRYRVVLLRARPKPVRAKADMPAQGMETRA
jgi:simple sugar transport system permease protein